MAGRRGTGLWTVALIITASLQAVVARGQDVKTPAEGTSGEDAAAGAGGVVETAAIGMGEQEQAPRSLSFDLGAIDVVGAAPGQPGIGASVLTREQMWTLDRTTLDQAVNIVPGVVSTLDSNGRRNESDVFVRGFGRWQVPLLMDGIRIYLPADNRLDFGRFLTADVASVQVQKGYASVLDGPGAMGGAINLVTRVPTRRVEVEGSLSGGGRSERETWSAYGMVGTRRSGYYAQASANLTDRNFWTISNRYAPTSRSLQPSGARLGSDSRDWRVNAKVGLTPNRTDEYTVNVTRQSGQKGAPLNIYNNPPVPANAYWRWPYWDIQNVALLSHTQVRARGYIRSRVYLNTFKNGLDAYDDGSYTTQSLPGRFRSPYDDRAHGVSVEAGVSGGRRHDVKVATHLRWDLHREQQTSRPTNATLATTEPSQEQAQHTYSVAAEDTIHLTPTVSLVTGASYESYRITRAQEYTAARGLFELPSGGARSPNGQAALIWRYSPLAEVHASVSDRARFPVIFELYSTRFGTATPNPDLGPERTTNMEVGWQATHRRARLDAAVFSSRVRDLIQTVVLPDATTQTQNVGTGRFSGFEVAVEAPLGRVWRLGGNYTYLRRRITDALQPALRPTGVPTHKAFVQAVWKPHARASITPSLDLGGDRWSDVNPAPAVPFVRTGAFALLNVVGEFELTSTVGLAMGVRNLADDYYELAWGFPQPGRTFYIKTRIAY